jgi:hypothetical protein
MTGTEKYSLPPEIEWDTAPAMFKMDANQTYFIDMYGADLSSNGEPLGLTDRDGRELLPGARSSVRVIIGENGGCDYLDVMDLGACPWYDKSRDTGGNFALFRWTETDMGGPAIVGAETLEPGKILKLGRRDAVFAETPYHTAVQDEHVTIGIQSTGRLLIRNHNHRSRTEVWNMQFGRNVARPVLLEKQELAAARTKKVVWHVGTASARKAIAPLQTS